MDWWDKSCFRTWMTCHNWWNHELCTLSENPEGECMAVSLWPQAYLGYAAGQWSRTHQQVHLWIKPILQRRVGQNSSTATWKTQLLLQRVAVIRFRGLLLFHVGPGRFGPLFSLNKWDHYFKTAFCIYPGYLCVVLKFVDDLNHSSVTYAKNWKKAFTPLYLYIYIYIYIYICVWCVRRLIASKMFLFT